MLRRFTLTTTKKNLLPVSSSVASSINFLSSIKRFQTTSSDQSQKNTTSTNADDDDFVADSAFLNMMEENNNNNNDNSSSNNLVPVQPLGIERFPNVPEGTRFSRLNNVVTSQPAPNVPTQRKASLDAPEMDEVTSLLQREEIIEQMGREGLSMSDAQMKLGLTSSSMKKGAEGEATKNGEHSEELDEENANYHISEDGAEAVLNDDANIDDELPYDDAAFAEAILKMEVEGAIDETWQDTVQAKPEDVKEIADVLRDARARDVVAIDVRTKTSNFDFIVVATCESQRHMTLVAWSVSEADKWNRVTKPSRRKADELWDVVPVGRILVNLMLESYRNEVTIERKWAVTKSMDPLDAAHTRVSESRQNRMHGLWSLTMNLQDLEDFEIDYCKDVLMSQL